MRRPHVPQEVLDAAHARKAARSARDWPEADRLKASIEAAGWRVVDRGADFALLPAQLPDVRDGDRIRFGSSQGVPSRLAEPDAGPASLILRVAAEGVAVAQTIAATRAHSPAGTQLVVVGDGPDPDTAAALEALEAAREPNVEVVWLAGRRGAAAATNAGLRRATGSVVIVLDPGLEPTGDVVAPLVAALADPSVAIAGMGGLAGADVRDLVPAQAGLVVALDGTCLAMRRRDAAARGPLDEQFAVPQLLGAWWSLVLRDEGEGRPARRAVALDGLPLVRRAATADDQSADDRRRSIRRDRYRLLDRFGHRPDLLAPSGPS